MRRREFITLLGSAALWPLAARAQKIDPDMKKIGKWMQRYFYAVALQGTMQVAIIVVMTRFRAGI